jgi:hypothetical protein
MTACQLHRVVVFTVLGFCSAGCTSDNSQGTVTGKVTLDGQPLKTGLIRFVPADGQSATADATVTDGDFSANVPVGEKRVQITAPKVVGQRKMYQTADSPMVDIIEELLPGRYNVRSDLTATVEPGRQQLTFELTSKK